jgi:hypothetical protein
LIISLGTHTQIIESFLEEGRTPHSFYHLSKRSSGFKTTYKQLEELALSIIPNCFSSISSLHKKAVTKITLKNHTSIFI